MSLERLLQRIEARRRLNELLNFRSNKSLTEAAMGLIDKEISDLEDFLRSKAVCQHNVKMTTLRDAAI
ncbi:hypothetical protein [Paenibacillus donghaensis]|uniref:Uncharacterized protein n=1 Tax=Paenibacillus donghaensis TaxID=414771 RepID=A0A2Z2KB86_9BACL|nr:hypothetical protein [Paenibacillus donghaensis]ASA20905.1 hypothetical protein B9T62_08980 [Paenibacillus donghaensis]